ncbi:MAG: OmpH family outer membrane protein [Phycisphaerales bacterium]|nr:OmpH family outer membrane protein [Phycisphaerales bacterium]
MNRSWWLGIVTGSVVALAVLAGARELGAYQAAGPSGRVAVVDVIRTLNEFQKQKDLVQQVTAQQQALEAENRTRREKIDLLQAEIERLDPQDPTLPPRMRELLAMQVDYKNWAELSQLNLAREFGLWSIQMYRDLIAAVNAIAQAEGYDLVLYRGEFEAISMDPEVVRDQIRGNQVLYSATGINITQQVLDRMNTDYRAQGKVQMVPNP